MQNPLTIRRIAVERRWWIVTVLFTFMMNAAAPDGAPPRRFNTVSERLATTTVDQKTSLSRRAP